MKLFFAIQISKFTSVKITEISLIVFVEIKKTKCLYPLFYLMSKEVLDKETYNKMKLLFNIFWNRAEMG